MIKVKKGLNVPISGAPESALSSASELPTVERVGVVGADYVGVKPSMRVKVGDKVQKGQILFEDKKNPGVVFTSPVNGEVESINRGERRVFRSLVVRVEGDAAADGVEFKTFSDTELTSAKRDEVVDILVASGAWTALRTRPFSKIPAIDSSPAALFVNAMDTNPLSVDPAAVFGLGRDVEHLSVSMKSDFVQGQRVLQKLTDGAVYVCASPSADIPVSAGVQLKRFSGAHPAGLVGTHIHFLSPVSANRTVWHIGYQDVVAIGRLFRTGQVDSSRVVALGGPQVQSPRLLSTVVGADLLALTAGMLKSGENRVVSGSPLSGRRAYDDVRFLGRFHQQISVLLEGRERRLFDYVRLGLKKHSVLPVFGSKWLGESLLPMTTTTNGSDRGMVPVGSYEKVMPLDILPTQLLRSLIVGDVESAQALGCLELDEEDLGLCTYVCPSKYDYGPILRDNLTQIELDG